MDVEYIQWIKSKFHVVFALVNDILRAYRIGIVDNNDDAYIV